LEIWGNNADSQKGGRLMIEQTFFCIRPYCFEKRDIIKKLINDKGFNIKKDKPVWLTEKDLRVMYAHEEPSTYFDACVHFMTHGFAEVGIIEGEEVISKLVKLVGHTHIPNQNDANTLRRIFGEEEPISFNGFDYYFNPLHRSSSQEEAEREIALFWTLYNRPPVETISNMMHKLYKDKNLECVYHHHIKLAVRVGLELCEEFGGDKTVVELACWLHDIASLKSGTKYEHHIEGMEGAEDILKILEYKTDVIRSVKHCIQTHRGTVPLAQMTKEAEIVCAADGIANLRCPPLLYFFAFKIKDMEFNEGMKSIKQKLENSYNKIPHFAKEKAKQDYEDWSKLLHLLVKSG